MRQASTRFIAFAVKRAGAADGGAADGGAAEGAHMRDIERYDARSSLRRWKNASSTSRRKT
jgi:hypothetical protein